MPPRFYTAFVHEPTVRDDGDGGRGAGVSRVLIGGFDTIAAMGLREVLDDEGFELVADGCGDADDARHGDTPGSILRRLVAAAPDVVVLDLDVEQGPVMAEEISRRFPAIKVIACSAEVPLMRIYPPFHHGDFYVSVLSARLLAEAVRS
jgi:hypothetical protein